jgi:ABC-type transport system involved in cytochrome bd biosynthesis fused ATPase/permease subunit
MSLIITLGIFISPVVFAQSETKIVEKTFILNAIDIVILLMAAISIILGIVSLIFSWIFYKNSAKVNRDTRDNLSKISQKIEKIDDIVSNQFNKMFGKLMGKGTEYEGKIPISNLQFAQKTKKIKEKIK